MIKKLLLKIAHLIIGKYNTVPLGLKNMVCLNGQYFYITGITINNTIQKTTAEIELLDVLSTMRNMKGGAADD